MRAHNKHSGDNHRRADPIGGEGKTTIDEGVCSEVRRDGVGQTASRDMERCSEPEKKKAIEDPPAKKMPKPWDERARDTTEPNNHNLDHKRSDVASSSPVRVDSLKADVGIGHAEVG